MDSRAPPLKAAQRKVHDLPMDRCGSNPDPSALPQASSVTAAARRPRVTRDGCGLRALDR